MAFRRADDPRITLAAVVSTSTDGLSPGYDLQGYRVASIDMSTAWTDGVLTFRGCNSSGGTYQSLWNPNGLEIAAQTTANLSIVVDSDLALALQAHRFVQIRSGRSTGEATQAAARTLTLVLLPT